MIHVNTRSCVKLTLGFASLTQPLLAFPVVTFALGDAGDLRTHTLTVGSFVTVCSRVFACVCLCVCERVLMYLCECVHVLFACMCVCMCLHVCVCCVEDRGHGDTTGSVWCGVGTDHRVQ